MAESNISKISCDLEKSTDKFEKARRQFRYVREKLEEASPIKQLNIEPKTLFFRHFKKQYRNGKSETYRLDPDIQEIEMNINKKVSIIIKKYGIPRKIISSPFKRCTSTSYVIKTMLEELGFDVPIEIDVSWGEYLGNQTNIVANVDFRQETASETPIIETNWNEFADRIQNLEAEKGVWIVTHKLIIEQFALTRNKKLRVSENFYGYEC